MIRLGGLVLLLGFATLWLLGCKERCEEAVLRRDPASGECIPLSSCYLTAEQATWEGCDDDPCVGRDENSCLADTRCQPAYAILNVDREIYAHKYPDRIRPAACIQAPPIPPLQPDDPANTRTIAGVNNGEPGKHPSSGSRCFRGNQRVYSGCRIVPRMSPLHPPCSQLTYEQCSSRIDCVARSVNGGDWTCSSNGGPCSSLSDEQTCLTNPRCEAIGTDCYCPPNAKCDCSGGEFMYCQINDRLRRCASSADCNADERCDNDEDCIIPRTYDAPPVIPTGPGSPGCLGACVPAGCAGLGEQQCNANPSCDVGSYLTACTDRPVYYGSIQNQDPETVSAACTGNTCTCNSEFASCVTRTTNFNQRAERSLLVRDPPIIDDPAFSLPVVLNRLAPVGRGEDFVQSMLSLIAANRTLSNGAVAKWRAGFAQMYRTLTVPPSPALSQKFLSNMVTTALINRLDLASAQDCGQARISFAMTKAYWNGNERMTLIVELRVPDDGSHCKLVAQRWAELAYLDDMAERRTRLIALYDELLKPANLSTIRTNEFVNIYGSDAWELRQFQIRAEDGLLDLAPVAQTLNPRQTNTPEVTAWLRDNAMALKAGTAIIPTAYLAGASTEDGGRLKLLPDSDLQRLGTEKTVNELSCAGCHLTETGSPFVHIGERLAKRLGNEYVPSGRAVIDSFLQNELPKRLTLLDSVLAGTNGLRTSEWRPTVQPRVH